MIAPNLIAKYMVSFERFLPKEQARLVADYASYLRNGLQPLSEDTVRVYMAELATFLRHQDHEQVASVGDLVTRAHLTRRLTSIPNERVSSRRNLLFAVKNFARYLRDLDVIEEKTYEAIALMKLRAKHEPVRRFLTPVQWQATVETILNDDDYNELERLTNLAIFSTMMLTGLRNSELCRLRLVDVDFERGLIQVIKGKRNKNRTLGLPDRLAPLLRLYLASRPKTDEPFFFVGPSSGVALNRDAIVKRSARLSRKVGFNVGAHICRRSFATHRAHDGVPLDKLQVVMGHADIKTTRMYVQTREDTVASEMKAW